MPAKTYDRKCHDLALHFLEDERSYQDAPRDVRVKMVTALASTVQQAAEDCLRELLPEWRADAVLAEVKRSGT